MAQNAGENNRDALPSQPARKSHPIRRFIGKTLGFLGLAGTVEAGGAGALDEVVNPTPTDLKGHIGAGQRALHGAAQPFIHAGQQTLRIAQEAANHVANSPLVHGVETVANNTVHYMTTPQTAVPALVAAGLTGVTAVTIAGAKKVIDKKEATIAEQREELANIREQIGRQQTNLKGDNPTPNSTPYNPASDIQRGNTPRSRS